MAEYIEREALLKKLAETRDSVFLPKTMVHSDTVLQTAYKGIASIPDADVVEVVHGRWITEDYDSGEPEGYAAFICVQCSKCRYSIGAENGEYGWYYGDPFPLKYCPNCGARMDGE